MGHPPRHPDPLPTPPWPTPDRIRTIREVREKCPRCGSPLLTDGKHAWCSLVVAEGQTPCLYGIESLVGVKDIPLA